MESKVSTHLIVDASAKWHKGGEIQASVIMQKTADHPTEPARPTHASLFQSLNETD